MHMVKSSARGQAVVCSAMEVQLLEDAWYTLETALDARMYKRLSL